MKYAVMGSALAAYVEGAKKSDTKRGGLRNGGDRKLGYTGKTGEPTIEVSLSYSYHFIHKFVQTFIS